MYALTILQVSDKHIMIVGYAAYIVSLLPFALFFKEKNICLLQICNG